MNFILLCRRVPFIRKKKEFSMYASIDTFVLLDEYYYMKNTVLISRIGYSLAA